MKLTIPHRLLPWRAIRQTRGILLIFLVGGAILVGSLRYLLPQTERGVDVSLAATVEQAALSGQSVMLTTALSPTGVAGTASRVITQPLTTTQAAVMTDTLSMRAVTTDTVRAGNVATGTVSTSVGESATSLLPLERTLNILVLGSDQRVGTTNWRTDVMMIVALDFEHERAGVISVPRDLYIDVIPNHQPNRVNVIDYLGERDEGDGGGPSLLSTIIGDKMEIRIDHFLRFDFNSFQAVVDALGGVDVDIDCPFRDYFSVENTLLNLEPGIVRMDGEQALVYVRSRRFGGDLDRARRQQRFVWAVRNQMLKENMLPRVPALYEALNDSIQTDIGIVNAIRIVRFALALQEEEIHGFVLAPPDLLTSGWRAGMSVFLPDWPAIRRAVQTVFDRPAFIETNTPAHCP